MFRSLTKRVVALAAMAVTVSFATPAAANSSSAADMFRIDEAATTAPDVTALGQADPAFRTLFAQWDGQSSKSTSGVSVPSLYPVDMKNIRKSSGFGARSAPTKGASTNHKGIDLAGPMGTPIYATADGVVARADWSNGYGKLIVINHGHDIETRYGHLSGFNTFAGQKVKKGDLIGFLGTTGRSTGPHLHYEVRLSGVAMNPAAFMQEDRNATNMLLAAKSSATNAQ